MKRKILGLIGIMLILASAAFAADTWKTTVDLDGRHMHAQETNLGNFVADAIRTTTKADIALIQASAFQEDALIKAGLVDEQTMRSKLTAPTSTLFVLTMRPVVLRKIMERAVSNSVVKPFLQISGMVVTYDSSKEPDNRVVSITVNGKPLDFADEKRTLTVAMPEELGRGAAGYTLVYPKEVKASAVKLDQTVIGAIKNEFTRLNGEISPAVDGRLKDIAPKEGEKKDK